MMTTKLADVYPQRELDQTALHAIAGVVSITFFFG
jgi:hypothetical protein